MSALRAFDVLDAELEGSTLVEASAGTGKTFAIATLFVRLLLERGLGVDQILVVTFTEAATAELRDRVRLRLGEALASFELGKSNDAELEGLRARSRDPARDRERLVHALRDADRAAIHTIHGFCQRMLREAAFESGVAYDVELVSDARALVTELVADFWARELYDAPQPLVRALAQSKLEFELCRTLAERVTRQPELPVLPLDSGADRWFEGVDPSASDLARTRFLRRLVDYARAELPRRKQAKSVLAFDDLLQRLLAALRGTSGSALGRSIRSRFPAALIDEFQDTDPVQYAIFRAIYNVPRMVSERAPSLFLIGDPKQAIYGFRGADVFAYLDAVRHTPAGRKLTMRANYRADPGLVQAVSSLFDGLERPFLLEGIELPEVSAARKQDAFFHPTASSAPLEILFVPRAAGEKRILKGVADPILPGLVAAEIADLLRSGATLDGRPVEAGDIAVLTRKNQEAFDVQRALHELGISSVLLGDSSVFDRPEAGELAQVLAAISDPSDAPALRAALVSPLIGVTASELAEMDREERAWDDWVGRFREWNQLWSERGLVPMFRRLLGTGGVQERALARPDGERRMTNFLHLLELCHAAEREGALGLAGVVHWLREQRRGGTDDPTRAEAAQIRLERDERAVKLLTVHKSKGLEFPIVYCPYLWRDILLSQESRALLTFHDPAHAGRQVLELDKKSINRSRQQALAEWEALAENLRLCYVALTRAKHRLTLLWGGFKDSEKSAIGYLLGWPRGERVTEGSVAQIAQRLSKLDDFELRAQLEARIGASAGRIVVRQLARNRVGTRIELAGASVSRLEVRRFERPIDRQFRTASFSQLAAHVRDRPSPSATPAEEGRDRDELAEQTDSVVRATAVSAGPPIVLADFPRGARAGNFFHEIFENMDFAEQAADSYEELVGKKLAEYGWDSAFGVRVCAALHAVVATPLTAGPNPLRLNAISRSQRLNELEFHLPVGQPARRAAAANETVGQPARRAAAANETVGQPARSAAAGDELAAASTETERFTERALARALGEHPSPALPASYAERLAELGFPPLAGWLKGYVDLIFQHENRFFLVDWKTNHLGDRLADYGPAQIESAMLHGHYYLQYHLYAVALHRYLARRLRDYDYDRDFGGVYYLFIKGMTPETGPERGIFFERPPRERIVALSERLAGRPTISGHPESEP